jgi:hypothetical protein
MIEDKIKCDAVLRTCDDGSEWILDSGLYSLMFGAHKGKISTFDEYRDYALKYRENVERWGWKHPIVECDVQRVLGVEECMRIREEVFSDYIGTVIYVWHIPEGIEGLKALAKNEYIALSVPELRVFYKTPSSGGVKVKRALAELLAIAKEAGSRKVHLLGCTEADLLRLPAYSADSTSWYSGGRFGNSYVLERGNLKGVSAYSPKFDAWRKWIVEHDRWREGFAQTRSRQQAADKSQASLDYNECVGVGAVTFQILMESING